MVKYKFGNFHIRGGALESHPNSIRKEPRGKTKSIRDETFYSICVLYMKRYCFCTFVLLISNIIFTDS